jgi:hypothetical protein
MVEVVIIIFCGVENVEESAVIVAGTQVDVDREY